MQHPAPGPQPDPAADSAIPGAAPHPHGTLALRALGIDTQHEYVIYMRSDCHVCRSEGFQALTRVQVTLGAQHIVATVHMLHDGLLQPGEASLSISAWRAVHAADGARITVSHAPALDSLSDLRAKMYGRTLDEAAYGRIIDDVARGHYSEVHMAAFLSACAGGRMTAQETVALTRAMVQAGDRIDWGTTPVADKHCIGGLPGNRTTPIVVSIVAAAGLTIPKTSSRAITSPAGTADVMETLTRVDLDVAALRRVVDLEGGCLAWGGALTLSPADDLLIRVERPLDLDSDAQMVASVLSKKIAAGATHVVVDIPVGSSAKVRSEDDAARLQALLNHVALACGLHLRVVRSAGEQPVGHGIGPALEAHDVLAVLQGRHEAPADLRERALVLAAHILEFCGAAGAGAGLQRARALLASGAAWRKFQAICQAQGGLREPGTAPIRQPVAASQPGRLRAVDNRRLARVAKLLGAPGVPTAGIRLHLRLGDRVATGQPLMTLHAQARGELAYALDYLHGHPVFDIAPD